MDPLPSEPRFVHLRAQTSFSRGLSFSIRGGGGGRVFIFLVDSRDCLLDLEKNSMFMHRLSLDEPPLVRYSGCVDVLPQTYDGSILSTMDDTYGVIIWNTGGLTTERQDLLESLFTHGGFEVAILLDTRLQAWRCPHPYFQFMQSPEGVWNTRGSVILYRRSMDMRVIVHDTNDMRIKCHLCPSRFCDGLAFP